MSFVTPTYVPKVMLQPINLIFRHLQNHTKVHVWLQDRVNLRIEGYIIGFDEFMNLVLDEASEVNLKTGWSHRVGRMMLKGRNITVIEQKLE